MDIYEHLGSTQDKWKDFQWYEGILDQILCNWHKSFLLGIGRTCGCSAMLGYLLDWLMWVKWWKNNLLSLFCSNWNTRFVREWGIFRCYVFIPTWQFCCLLFSFSIFFVLFFNFTILDFALGFCLFVCFGFVLLFIPCLLSTFNLPTD